MKASTRPKRPQKYDRFTRPDATATDTAIYHAVAPFDEMGRKMEIKWGVDRLHALMTPEVAAKWGTTMNNLNAAIASQDVAAVIECVASCLRGLDYMDTEAERQGHHPQSPDVWEAEIDGFHFAILKDGAQWPALKAARPDIRYFTMREVANALKAYGGAHPLVQAAKAAFAQTEITAVNQKSDLEDLLDDEIPF